MRLHLRITVATLLLMVFLTGTVFFYGKLGAPYLTKSNILLYFGAMTTGAGVLFCLGLYLNVIWTLLKKSFGSDQEEKEIAKPISPYTVLEKEN